ncbi:MAG: tyrosine-type recombinase/integrase [Candidatus Sericytochromatia bacterium]
MSEKILNDFKIFLLSDDKSKNTIKSYLYNINIFFRWYQKTYQENFNELKKEHVTNFKSYLANDLNRNAKTINHYLITLKYFNSFLLEQNYQPNFVITNKMNIKIQTQFASPTNIHKEDIDLFEEKIINSGNLRNVLLINILKYTGLRISEALNIRYTDFNLDTRECVIRSGKGGKQRTVFFNEKVLNILEKYLKTNKKNSIYLFSSNKSDKLNRTVVNRIFQKYSNNTITPHDLRHFFCTNALEKGFGIHEVANIAGHSNIQTTLLYTNPTKKKIQNKMELL